jgi:mono/diheme cytochrome c family protein
MTKNFCKTAALRVRSLRQCFQQSDDLRLYRRPDFRIRHTVKWRNDTTRLLTFLPMTIGFLIISVAFFLTSCAGGGTSRIEAQKMQNPIEPTEKSIASGKKYYDRYCAECHGEDGRGFGPKVAELKEIGAPKVPDLTDDRWDHGSTDGEIFVNIRDGVGAKGVMKGLNGKPGVGETEIWNIVNYMKTLRKPE